MRASPRSWCTFVLSGGAAHPNTNGRDAPRLQRQSAAQRQQSRTARHRRRVAGGGRHEAARDGDAYLGVQRNRLVTKQRDIDVDDPTNTSVTKNIQNGDSLPRSAHLTFEQPIFDGFAERNARGEIGGLRGTRAAAPDRTAHIIRHRHRLYECLARHGGAQTSGKQCRGPEGAVPPTRGTLQVRTDHLDGCRAGRGAGAERQVSAQPRAPRFSASVGVARRSASSRRSSRRARRSIAFCCRSRARKRSASRRPNIPLILPHCMTPTPPTLTSRRSRRIHAKIFNRRRYLYANRSCRHRQPQHRTEILGHLNVPIYEGGLTSSRVRQAEEPPGQRRLTADVARAEVLSLVRTYWGALQAAKTQIASARTPITAAERALRRARRSQGRPANDA